MNTSTPSNTHLNAVWIPINNTPPTHNLRNDAITCQKAKPTVRLVKYELESSNAPKLHGSCLVLPAGSYE